MPTEEQTQSDSFPLTARTTLKRLPKRGAYDRKTIDNILDEGLICHVGFVVDGQPFVIPTIYARCGDKIYMHGSPASRMLNTLKQGSEVCVTVTLIDGLVLARSVFHHSMNYRSVIIFGRAAVVEDPQEKMNALRTISEHLIRGRWDDARGPNEKEFKGTMVVCVPIAEASAKIRSGPPIDDEEDYDLPVWAGVVPLQLTASAPVNDPQLKAGIAPPDYATHYVRPKRAKEK
jgi:hypothetical protein